MKDPELQSLAVQPRDALAICAQSEAINTTNAAINAEHAEKILVVQGQLSKQTDEINLYVPRFCCPLPR